VEAEVLTEAPVTKGLTSVFCHIRGGIWSVTPYALCDHRCTYCCTFVQGRSDPLATPAEAVAEFRRARQSDDPMVLLLLGAFSDAYPPVEREHRITRALVREFAAAGIEFGIITKGDTVLRDIDLLQGCVGPATVQVSICCTDDDVLARLDVGAPSGTRRFEVIDELRAAGVHVELNVLPWIPGVTDTAALIARVPDDLPITFGPLSMGQWSDSRKLLGREHRRQDVWEAYLDEYRTFGHHANTSWIRPSLSPVCENDPMHRLAWPPDPAALAPPARGGSACSVRVAPRS
jgi:DNA repair photolyase